MKQNILRKLPLLLSLLVGGTLVLVPFHAILTVSLSNIVGHYTALRLWKEVLLLIATLAAGLYLAWKPHLFRALIRERIVQLAVLYVVVVAAWAVFALGFGTVSPKAALYGVLSDTRFVWFMLVAWVTGLASGYLWQRRFHILLIPAAIVILFGLLQRFLLPYDVLKHLGYGRDTIPPYQTIDKKVEYFRIISTLRGANPLGAYMAFIIGMLASLSLSLRTYRWIFLGMGLAATVVLAASQSRSAWIAAVLTVTLVVVSKFRHTRHRRVVVAVFAALAITGVGSLAVLRNNDFVQNTFFHTDENSVADTSSNSAHIQASSKALKQVFTEPLGRGPGTAGPASVYNEERGGRIAENYYLQIGQETGLIGLGLFLAICWLVMRALYRRRQDVFVLGLFASFIGLIVINLLSHAWADDTLAYLWWGFAGLAIAAISKTRE